ncbi:MAG: HAMP domain-containing histidine kinase [Aquabacterium sp.]|uniref:sensor histidine kinase n=1 Tax=Aquabacterium sp. TaxID=1872578 RepID=UPI0025BB6894|nr:HAMP domain-containing sensor histidine kinase [Aquabacterium sp.]MBI5925392.1 HAMP domain-containing histidine kinase [Aquabacterium sp.]
MITLTFSEGLAVSAGVMQAFVAATFWRFKHARPEWGLGWLAAAYGMGSLLNIGAPVLIKAQQVAGLSLSIKLVALVLGISTMGALVAGLHKYTRHARLSPWRWFLIMWVLYALNIALRAAYPVQMASSGNMLTAIIFVYLISLFISADRREPTAGHGAAALMLSAYPMMVVSAILAGFPPNEVLYWASIPFTLAGLGVMSATMGRLRSELKELNVSLERRVQERTQELQELVTSLEQFNGMVSHDLRGPLGGISGLSAVALQAIHEGDIAKAKRLFDVINVESGRLAELVSDLLTLAKVSHSELRRQASSLEELMQEAVRLLKVSHGDHAVSCIRHGPLPSVDVDPALLRQVLVNLIGNALKFSRQAPSPDVHVHAEKASEGITVHIQDNGVGFDPDKKQVLFSPFKRLHASSEFEGTGIGLTIVKRIIERHGGHVWADSRPGQGATFSFYLPQGPASHRPPEPAH